MKPGTDNQVHFMYCNYQQLLLMKLKKNKSNVKRVLHKSRQGAELRLHPDVLLSGPILSTSIFLAFPLNIHFSLPM